MMIFIEIFEAFRIAYSAIRANLLRSILTVMGILIGITFVILTGWALSSLDNALQETMNLLGTDIVYVDKFDWSGKTSWLEARNRKDISTEEANTLIERLTTAESATLMASNMSGTLSAGDTKLPGISIIGTYSENAAISVGTIERGRFHLPIEDQITSYVTTIGFNVAKELFPDSEPVGQYIQHMGRDLLIVGVVESRATAIMDEIDSRIYIPLKVFEALYGSRGSRTVIVKAGSPDNLENVRLEATGIMREIRNIPPGAEDDFSLNELEMFREVIDNLRIQIGGIALLMTVISFIVGSIGIMNIMFVSVTERTREIGVRKALGAKRRTILLQFLIESIGLCFLGVAISLPLCSLIILWAVDRWPDFTFLMPYIPMYIIVTAVAVSVIVGILAGIIPSFVAARKDPVQALSYE